ncbi:MAG: Ig-like domain-containing protein [Candidatus Paceibacterota bacterium]
MAFDRPEFTEYPVRLNAGVIPVIKGVTRPQSVVTISLEKQDGSVAQEYEVTADAAGVFTFIPDGALTNGVYELTATAIDTYGAAK